MAKFLGREGRGLGADRFATFEKWPKHVRGPESNCPLTWAFRVFYQPHEGEGRGRGRVMSKTWEKTCSEASIIVPNLDFSRWWG